VRLIGVMSNGREMPTNIVAEEVIRDVYVQVLVKGLHGIIAWLAVR